MERFVNSNNIEKAVRDRIVDGLSGSVWVRAVSEK
jgi:hypothetical protein